MTNQMQDYLGFSTGSVAFPFRLQALCSSSLLGFDMVVAIYNFKIKSSHWDDKFK